MGPTDQFESSQVHEVVRLRSRVAELERQLSQMRSFSTADDSLVAIISRLMQDALTGVPEFSFIGRTIEEAVPHLATQLRPAFTHVFANGEPLLNVEWSAASSETA